MEETRVQIGDLISLEPWDCEGIENPYGYKIYDKRDWDPQKKKMFEKLSGKVRIVPGSKALVTGRESVDLGNIKDTMFWCLVEGRQLRVSSRFVQRVD
jgi:hypothetical protein